MTTLQVLKYHSPVVLIMNLLMTHLWFDAPTATHVTFSLIFVVIALSIRVIQTNPAVHLMLSNNGSAAFAFAVVVISSHAILTAYFYNVTAWPAYKFSLSYVASVMLLGAIMLALKKKYPKQS